MVFIWGWVLLFFELFCCCKFISVIGKFKCEFKDINCILVMIGVVICN